MKGKFITFEGIDGSGKTTIIRMLSEKIKNSVITSEPTDTWLGKAVEKAISEGKNPLTVALLFMADRNEHIFEIKKWINDGKVVLCDRYFDSTYAYQREALKDVMDNPEKWIENVQRPFIIVPDITILLVLPVEIAIERIKGRKRMPYERKEFLERVQENYIEMAKKEKRFIVIDAGRDIKDVYNECYDAVSKFLFLPRDSESQH